MELLIFMQPILRSGFILFLVAPLSSIAVSQIAAGGAPTSPVRLEVGAPIERDLKGGETHVYSFSMERGQFAAVVVDQRGVDVVVRVKEPNGTSTSEMDSPNGTQGPEPTSIIAKSPGVYFIEVSSLDAKAPAGRYEVKLEAIRLATVQDKTADLAGFLVDTKSVPDRANRLSVEKDLVTGQLAEELIKIGAASLRGNDPERAMVAFTHARTIAEQTQASGQAAVAMQYIGNVYMTQRKPDLALEAFKTSLQFAEQANDKLKIADSLERLGQVYSRQGKYDLAMDSFRKSLPLAIAAGHKRLTDGLYISMGHVLIARGDFSSAIDEYNKSLAIAVETGNKLGIAWAHNNIGIGYNRQGLYAQSLEHYNKALPIFQELNDKRGIAAVTSNIGITYGNQGNDEGELETDLKVLSLYEEIGDQSLIGRALNNVAVTYRIREEWAKAMEYYQKSLAVRKSLNDKNGEAVVLNGIGLALFSQKQYDRALENFERSIKLRSEFEDNDRLAETLNNVARVYDAKGDNERALDFASRSAALSAKYNYREMHWFSLASIGRAYAKLNRPDEARKALDASIQIVDSIRIDVAGPHSKAFYFSGAQLPFDLYVDLLMQMHKKQPTAGYAEEAMLFSERIRARSLLEAISQAGTDIRRGVSEDLLTRERKLYENLNQLAFRQSRLQEKDEKERAEISLEIAELTREHDVALDQIRRQSPAYSTLTQRESVDLKTIRNEVLDDETVMIQYFVGKDRGYGWVVTKQTLDSFELPSYDIIEPAVKKVYGFLSEGKATGQEPEVAAAMSSLSKMLLGPAAEKLRKKRVLILAHGPLQYVPFGALYDPNSPDRTAVPLNLRNEVVNLPSVSAQVLLARNRSTRARASKTIAVFADPVFDQTDGRVAAERSAPADGKLAVDNTRVKKSVAEVGAMRNGTVQRLPFTRREADDILKIAPKSGVLKATDFHASRDTAMSSEVTDYRIVHFATHGIMHSRHPELSGIVLSLVNEKGEPVNGFLRLNDIYNMNLNADLVVLSACQTALGKEVRGEGLIGLTRGFMYAGSPRVVASLWKVDDVATAELMKIFYQKMLKENMRPAAALREAKIAVMKQKRWSSPYYWAAFELHGDWR